MCRPIDKCNFINEIVKEIEEWTITENSECSGEDFDASEMENMKGGKDGKSGKGKGKGRGCESDDECTGKRRSSNDDTCCATITMSWVDEDSMGGMTEAFKMKGEGMRGGMSGGKCIKKIDNGMTIVVEGKGTMTKVCES